ncbi:hypothetical protein EG329_004457 [Mollisiaceae sp. DMI_Dod_QoI]|nr:hypothetical protein EG329_004457 [Helotiales sp. DMI_Dod_QoI]
MDKLSRLQALTGVGDVVNENTSTENSWWPAASAKANNIYEGTDSEDDEMITSKGYGTLDEKTEVITFKDGNRVDTTTVVGYKLQQGQLAPEGIRFMPFKTVTKYPYIFIGHGNRRKVAEAFFDKGQVYGHTYDLFYLYADQTGQNAQPAVLIPSKQFERLLEAVNSKLKTRLTIPKGSAGDGFYIGFMDDGNPQPRYLGRCTSKEEFDNLKFRIPPFYFKLDGEPGAVGTPSDRSLELFQTKFALITGKEKGRKAAQKEKNIRGMIQRQNLWGASTKRVESYMGLREMGIEVIQARFKELGVEWVDVKDTAGTAAAKPQPRTFFEPGKSMRFMPQDSVIFISVDVEAYEKNHKQITEIGVATLDTLDITKLAPGQGGENWMQKIRARHFRIIEHRHLINKLFVTGCPDNFEFGESEFISIRDAPSVIASCFKHPFSDKGNTSAENIQPKRNIVLVGHNISADITFLKDIGYDVTNLSNLWDTVDTADMWKYLKHETDSTKLAAILHDLNLDGWNLHNAGNDAVYTLQAMIGTAIKHVTDKDKPQDILDHEKRHRLVKNIAKAPVGAIDDTPSWEIGNGGGAAPGLVLESDDDTKAPVLEEFSKLRVDYATGALLSTTLGGSTAHGEPSMLSKPKPTAPEADQNSRGHPHHAGTNEGPPQALASQALSSFDDIFSAILNAPWGNEEEVMAMAAEYNRRNASTPRSSSRVPKGPFETS